LEFAHQSLRGDKDIVKKGIIVNNIKKGYGREGMED